MHKSVLAAINAGVWIAYRVVTHVNSAAGLAICLALDSAIQVRIATCAAAAIIAWFGAIAVAAGIARIGGREIAGHGVTK